MLHLFVVGCDGWDEGRERTITMEAFSELKTPAFVFDVQDVRSNLLAMVKSDDDVTEADRQARSYYTTEGNPLVWLRSTGIDDRADSLLSWLHRTHEIGMSERAFCVQDILKRAETALTVWQRGWSIGLPRPV